MKVRVKICGITNLADAQTAVRAGADLLGFVFYAKSPRFIPPGKARLILRKISRRVRKVGVFVNASVEDVKRTAAACRLDYLQFHGEETPAYLRRFKGYKIIKAVRVKGAASLRQISRYPADFFLFDAFHKKAFGGTGRTFDWALLERLKNLRRPFFISGGLTPQNVSALLKRIRPYGVDVSSGVELKAGKKSSRLIRRFMEQKNKVCCAPHLRKARG